MNLPNIHQSTDKIYLKIKKCEHHDMIEENHTYQAIQSHTHNDYLFEKSQSTKNSRF